MHMKKTNILLLFLLCLGLLSNATAPVQKSKSDKNNLKTTLSFLASDELRGRNTGTPEAQRAAEFIANKFQEYNLTKEANSKTTYFQTFSILSSPLALNGKIKIIDNSQTIYNYSDIISLTSKSLSNCNITPYLGDIDSLKRSSDYFKVVNSSSIEDAITLIQTISSKSGLYNFMVVLPTKKFIELNKSRTVLSGKLITSQDSNGDTLASTMFSPPILLKKNLYYSKVLPFLAANSNINIIIADDFFIKRVFEKDALTGYPNNIQPSIGKSIAIDGTIDSDKITKKPTANVIGVIPGTKRKDEVVVVCAHYDHIGVNNEFLSLEKSSKDSICNGADDNASGTSAIIEIARLLSDKKSIQPQRTIIIAAFTGEEEGLLGSQYFADNPTVPLNKIKAIVNLDMVGRTNSEHSEKDMYVYALSLGNPDIFTPLIDANANKAAIVVPKKIPEKERQLWTIGSDHYSFVKKDIPALVLTTGEHPDYHTPSDETFKINFERLVRITDFAYYMIWDLANKDNLLTNISKK